MYCIVFTQSEYLIGKPTEMWFVSVWCMFLHRWFTQSINSNNTKVTEKQQLGWKRIRGWRSYIARLNTWLTKVKHISAKNKIDFVLRHIPPIHVHERLKWRNAASSLSETETEEPESCSKTTLRLACWLFDIRLVSQRGRMTSVAACWKHVCHRCIFTGQVIYIFVTIYQRGILLLGVYTFF